MSRRSVPSARNCFASLALTAALLVSFPASAHDSPDWGKVQAEIKALPQDFGNGMIAQSALDEVNQKIVPIPGAPNSWEVVQISASGYTAHSWAKRRPDGLMEMHTRLGNQLYDATGLIRFDCGSRCGFVTLSISDPISVSSSISATVKLHALGNLFGTVSPTRDRFHPNWGYEIRAFDRSCAISGSETAGVVESCTYSDHEVFGDFDAISDDHVGAQEQPITDNGSETFNFDPRLGIFESVDLSTDALDWKLDNQPWHSQTVSIHLSPAQKEQARALFKRGFDLFKAGDFVGAGALVASGLKTDPGNYLGWFTLGEIGRSAIAQEIRGWDVKAEYAAYQHTIDLAPDSPEAALAKGYLEALH